ncbi:unnamed protein product [Kuraishia capsulata CBS 1993]|uniref:Dol-P-Glc:Glc(2)Man(9)GlcNAc(2)-PP-Dol alpha-1,2-glucosyltransferase n=1 Tax=Kuraishia capsulata CBS 1993 TaxID=1382522 RepID=W6MGH5_9ASCO|nr:uncharacterized protein KUCA_T00000873001 [Kuraishia capsulata CBS 1993]CDK24906.1 unnamed protein product [Kuraishia capsulata CBS 1993]
MSYVGDGDYCSLGHLRGLNFTGWSLIVLVTIYYKWRSPTLNIGSYSVALSPILAVYSTLFYTDVWSTFFIFTSYIFALNPPFSSEFLSSLLASILGFVSVWFRQTNIVWNAFVAAAIVSRRAGVSAHSSSFLREAQQFVICAFESAQLLVPFALNFGAFVAFVYWNGGITVGDKQNHAVSIHLVQVFYCFTFMTGLSVPVWFSWKTVRQYVLRSVGSPTRFLWFLVEILLINFIIYKFTVVHPFILADNRHYTFYIWKRLIDRNTYSKYLLSPVYHFSTYVVQSSILRANTPQRNLGKDLTTSGCGKIMALVFTVCVLATIVPSPLFEPRYYILPLSFWRLLVAQRPSLEEKWRQPAEFVYYISILTLLFGIFLKYEFSWATETHPQRILW